jgi:hypothetical protein
MAHRLLGRESLRLALRSDVHGHEPGNSVYKWRAVRAGGIVRSFAPPGFRGETCTGAASKPRKKTGGSKTSNRPLAHHLFLSGPIFGRDGADDFEDPLALKSDSASV